MNRTAAAVGLAVAAIGLATTLTSTAAVAAPGRGRDAAIAHAHANINAHSDAVAGGRDDRYAVKDVIVDPDGSEHVRFDRTYKGIPVLGGDFVVHDDGSGQLRSVSKTQRASISVDTTPAVSSDEAARRASAQFPGSADSQSNPALLIDARHGDQALAWGVIVTGTTTAGDPSEMHYVLDATDGSLRDAFDGIETTKPSGGGGGGGGTPVSADLTGTALYDGQVALSGQLLNGSYSLKDLLRGGHSTSDLNNRTSGAGTLVSRTTPAFGDGTTADRATVAVDAQYGAAETWEYYKTVHGRSGIANDGKGAASRVHYGRNYSNAFWSDSCFCMTYGDGNGAGTTPLVALDVAGHEMTHGVTSRTAGLTYSGESGGLNEATSDIFGTMVEFYANNSKDAGDYLVGEKIHTDGHPIRWMADPSKDGYSANCWSSSVGTLNVHYSSGVANHLFYLLAEGSGSSPYGTSPTCNGSSISGIGRDAAAAIWYRALTVYMTSSTDYHAARTATLNAAADLYGSGSTEWTAVGAAWDAVSVS